MLFISGHKRFIRLSVFIVILCFAGCVNTKIESVKDDELPKGKTYRILEVFLKSGKLLNLEGKDPKFKPSYNGKENVIIYYGMDYKRMIIEIKDIEKMTIEIVEPDIGLTILVVVGVIAILAVLLFLVLLVTVGYGAH